MSKLDYMYKYLFLGETSVGKTSLLIRYSDDIFDSDSLPTLGVDVRYKYVTLENKRIRLDIWDTAGQERFKNITKNYLHGANGILYVYDITNKESFNKLKTWLNDSKGNISPETEKIIVGNKIDLEDEREVNIDTVKDFGEKHNIDVFEVSAKNGKGVEEIFTHLTKKLFQKKHIGVVQPGEDEFTMRRGSYVLNAESAKPKNNRNGEGCNC